MSNQRIFAYCVEEAMNKLAGKPYHAHLVEGFACLFARYMKDLIVSHEVDGKGQQLFVVGSPHR